MNRFEHNFLFILVTVMKNADKSIIQMLEIDKDHFIKINNVDKLRVLIGDLLKEIQRIKSTGDLQAAKYLVDTYGTKVNQSIHKEVLERLERLKLASSVGFITPILIKDENDNVVVKHDEDFVEHCLKLADEYIFSI